MEKAYVIRYQDGSLKIPFFVKYMKREFLVEYNGRLYDDKTNEDGVEDVVLLQLILLIKGLNIKNQRERLEFVYDKVCYLLDHDFYGENLCEFKENRCIHDRLYSSSCDGCCRTNDGKSRCKYLKNHRCSIRCISCKLHICSCLKKRGILYRVNDFFVMRYLYNVKQKLMVYGSFFMTREEILDYLERNSILYWCFHCKLDKFVREEGE